MVCLLHLLISTDYALGICFFYRFEEQEAPGTRSFFTEIIASISDIKFGKDGRYILSRDYMTLKVWYRYVLINLLVNFSYCSLLCVYEELEMSLIHKSRTLNCMKRPFSLCLCGNYRQKVHGFILQNITFYLYVASVFFCMCKCVIIRIMTLKERPDDKFF